MWQYVEFTITFSLIAFLFRNLKKPAFHLFTEDVKPNSYGYYQVEDMLMPKEEWIKYCNEEDFINHFSIFPVCGKILCDMICIS